jgi:hypothetical protein
MQVLGQRADHLGGIVRRLIVLLVVIAAGIPLILCLIALLFPYLLALAVGVLILRLVSWYRGRW